jgi:hypothetical protein
MKLHTFYCHDNNCLVIDPVVLFNMLLLGYLFSIPKALSARVNNRAAGAIFLFIYVLSEFSVSASTCADLRFFSLKIIQNTNTTLRVKGTKLEPIAGCATRTIAL